MEHTNHCRDALCQGCEEIKYHDPLCNETECQCDLIRAVRKDHRARIVKTLRNLADHMTNGGLDDKTKEAWVLRWASDLLSVEK